MKLKKSYILVIIIVFLGTIPLLTGLSHPKAILYEYLSTSINFQISASVTSFSALPILFDFILDFLWKVDNSGHNRNNWTGRFIIALTAFVCGLILLLSAKNTAIKPSQLLFTFVVGISFSIMVSSVLFSLHNIKPDLFTFKQTILGTFIFALNSLSWVYSFQENEIFSFIHIVLECIGFAYFLMTFLYWSYSLYKIRGIWHSDEYGCSFYLCSYLILFGFFQIEILATYLQDGPILMLILHGFSFTLVMLTTIPGRLAKMDVIKNKDDILDMRKEYIRYVSHEMRTPLNTVLLGIKLAISQVSQSTSDENLSLSAKDRKDTLVEISSACSVALDILNDLLLYDKLENSLLTIFPQPINVVDFINETVKMFSVQLREKNIQFTLVNYLQPSPHSFTSGHEPLRVTTEAGTTPILINDVIDIDKNKIGQVLRNLLSNAIKFTPSNGDIKISMKFVKKSAEESILLKQIPKLRRKISDAIMTKSLIAVSPYSDLNQKESNNENENSKGVSYENGFLVIEVSDNGAGMTVENQKRLFNEIIQFQPEILQNGGGSGLGMWITKGIVDLHKGKISVFSEGEGKGSTFTLKIPMKRKRNKARMSVSASSRMVREKLKYVSNENDSDNEDSRNKNGLPRNNKIDNRGLHSAHSRISGKSNIQESSSILEHPIPETSEHDSFSIRNKKEIKIKKIHEPLIPYNNSNNIQILNSNLIEFGDSVANINILGDKIQIPLSEINSNQTPNNPSKHLLVVDDSKLNRKMLCKCLILDGFTCDEAEDGLEAINKVKNILESLNTCIYDGILMDFMMPNLDGPSATREIRNLGYSGPIIGITGNALQTDKDHFKESGANEVLIKPVHIEKIRETFNSLV